MHSNRVLLKITMLGYLEPNDPEETRSLIITYVISEHPVFVSEAYYFRIQLNIHRSRISFLFTAAYALIFTSSAGHGSLLHPLMGRSL